MKRENYGIGVFTLSNVFSDNECNKLIQYAEETGFHATTMDDVELNNEHYRLNDRLFLTDTKLAHKIFKRIQHQLPNSIESCGKHWEPYRVCETFRIYKYNHEQYFKWHEDGYERFSNVEETFLTLLVYLNDNFTDGITQFPWEKIKPEKGMALLFPHNIRHRATAPIGGIKYVLRSNISFRLTD